MIFYFSATGNSLWIAERISSGIGGQIFDIAKELDGGCSYELSGDDKVVFVLPVYFYGLPLIAEDFLKRMKIPGLTSIHLVFNYGTFPGAAFKDAEKTFARYGYSIVSEYGVRMPENYIMLFQPPEEKEIKVILNEASDTIEDIVLSLKSDNHNDILPKSSVIKNTFGRISRPIYLYGRGTGRFYVNTSCTHCGKCVGMCPSKAIEMVDNIPTWTKKKCYRCNACLNRCPHKAIEFGHLTKNKRRYVNPLVKL